MKCSSTYLFTLLLAGTVFISCEKDADVKLPQTQSKLVIVSMISPQDTDLIVRVSKSHPLYSSNSTIQYDVTDVKVSLSDGATSVNLTYDYGYGYYVVKAKYLPILEGKKYWVYVNTPDGESANAQTTIPPRNTSLTVSVSNSGGQNNNYTHKIQCNWTDIPGQKNYYGITGFKATLLAFEKDTMLQQQGAQQFIPEGTDGGGLSSNVYMNYGETLAGGYSYVGGKIYLHTISEELYKYENKLANGGNASSPFSEPLLMFTNINNGFGVFAGYNNYIVSFVKP